MTVRDHLLVAERSRLRTGRFWKDCLDRARPTTEELERADRILGLLGLDDVADRAIESLSLGRGRLVELGRALMTGPQLLLLDEPSSGLDQRETEDLVRTLRDVQREHGTAVLLVEHDVEMVRAFTERLVVLDFGTVIAEGPTTEVLDQEAVRNAYLGEITGVDGVAANGRSAARPRRAAPADARVAPVLELRDVEAGYGPRSAPCSACRSGFPKATSSPSSARTVPGSPPPRASSRAWSPSPRVPCCSTAWTSPA
jgi:ABC-type multidrug transport system ATPase subunit